MRITPLITSRNFLAGVENLNEALERATNQVSSGKRLNRLSDSASGSAEVVVLNNQLAVIDRYTANAENTVYFLSVADSALGEAYDLVTAIFTRGSEAASGSNDAASRATLANEIRNLLEELLGLANTQVNGRSIFAGTRVTGPAFESADGTITYEGDQGANAIDIGESVQVRQNVPGDTVFQPAFGKVNALVTAIESGDADAISSALSGWSAALAGISRARVQIGADLGKLENVKSANEAQALNLKTRRGSIEDADLAKAITDLSQAQTALKATLSAQAAVEQYNLFDFLG